MTLHSLGRPSERRVGAAALVESIARLTDNVLLLVDELMQLLQ